VEDEPKTGRRRPSVPPPDDSGAAPGGRASYRIVIALLWVAVQVTLVMTAGRRTDGAFGFRMFSESSTLKLALYREVETLDGGRARIHVEDGVWTARGGDGANHRLTWYDRIPTPYWLFDQEMHAPYGASTQLARLSSALDDLASHVSIADDLETRRFVLDVTVRRNGREPVAHQLASHERALPPAPLARPTHPPALPANDGGT
jgi:hypothetical protein